MRFYTAVMHKDQGCAYGLTFPELPGCFAAADTWEDLPVRASEAIGLWLDGRDPASVTVGELALSAEDVQMELKDGAVLILMPYLPSLDS